MTRRVFPDGFLWGASTAAHQVEGGTTNQWSEWEKAHAGELAQSAERRLAWVPAWESVKQAATDPRNYISGAAVEHYSRYKEDFALLKDLHLNAYRFSIEWSRIEPEEGVWDEREVEHYRQYIAELHAQRIEPILTLWHWTMPVWFTDKGGFEKRSNVYYFERFAAKVGAAFGNELRYILTLNEPSVYAYFSYMTGEWPPQRHSALLCGRVYRNLAKAHRRAYTVLKEQCPQVSIGLSAHLSYSKVATRLNPAAHVMKHSISYIWNWWFLDHTKHQLDFVGVNYYHTTHIDWRGKFRNPNDKLTDVGWYANPSGIGPLVVQVWKRYRKPIIVTENGLADARDAQRQWWLTETLQALQTAIRKGADLRGYFHWSLLDNFEWAYGFWPEFGLVAVDRKTMKRTVRPSARWLAEYIKGNNS